MSVAGDPQSPAGRFVMGKNVLVLAVLLPVALVVGLFATADGGQDAAVPFVVAGLCLLGVVLGIVFLRRPGPRVGRAGQPPK